MRTLVVGASPQCPSSATLVRLAADCDLLVAVDGGARALSAAGLAPHILVGDADSLPPGELDRLAASGVECVRYRADKDASDLELALGLLRDRRRGPVIVTGVTGGRLDHELTALGALAAHAGLGIHLVTPSGDGWVLSANTPDSIRLAGVGRTVSVIALGGPATVSVSGMRWPLTRRILSPSTSLGLSNVITTECAAVSVHDGTVLVLTEDIGAGRATPPPVE